MPVDWDKFGDKPTSKKKKVDWSSFGGKSPSKGGGSGGKDGKRSILGNILHGTGSAVMAGLNILDRPVQATKALVKDARDNAGTAETLHHLGGALAGHGHMSFQESIGRHDKGVLGAVENFVGDVALDPTTYLTFGTTTAAKQGLKAAGEHLGEGAAKRIVDKGVRKGLTAGEKAKLAEKVTPKVMSKLEKGGQGGVKFAGHTVVAGKHFPHPVAATRAALAGTKAGEAFIPRAGVEAKYGRDLADDLGALHAQARAEAGHNAVQREARLFAAGKAVKDLGPEDRNILEAALDRGGSAVDVPERLRPAYDEMVKVRAEDNARQVAEGFLNDLPTARAKAGEKATRKLTARMEENAARIESLGPKATRARTFADEVKGRAAAEIGPQNGTKPLETAAMRVQAAQERVRRARAAAAGAEDAITRRAVADAERDLRRVVVETRREGVRRMRTEAADELARQHDTIHHTYGGQIRIPRRGEAGYGEWLAFKTEAGLERSRGRFYNPIIRRGDGSTYRLFSTSGQGTHFNDLVGMGGKGTTDLARSIRFTNDLAKQAKGGVNAVREGLDHVPDALRGDPFTDSAVRGHIDDAVRRLADETGHADEAVTGRLAEVYDKVARAAAGEEVKLTGKEKALLAAHGAEGAVPKAEAKLAATRGETIAKLTERGRTVGRKEGEAVGKAEQRARILENTLRSAEARQARLGAKAANKAAKAADKIVPPEEYLARFYTKEGRDFLRRNPEIAAKYGARPKELKAALEQAGHLKARTLFPDLSAQEIEQKVGNLFREHGMKGDLLEHNPFVKVSHSGALADRAIANKHYLQGVMKLRDSAGERVLMAAEDAGKKLPHGWVKIDGGPLGELVAHPAIAKEVERVKAIVVNEDAIREFDGLAGKLNTLWKAQATVPLVGGAGFHLRNAQGNIWLNFLAGVKNPADYARALRMQLGKGLTAEDRRLIELAKQHGVLDEGFFLHELSDPAAKGRLARLGKDQRGARLRAAANPASTEGVMIKSGRAVGSAVENNARLAHFVAKMRELGDADAAARSVKKYLFDYGDLTDFERLKLKKVIPFYTFMRKNVPVQFAEAARQPGKFTALAHTYNEAAQGKDRSSLPFFLQNEPYLPFNVRGQNIAIRPDLPPEAAVESLDPFKQSDLGMFGGFGPALLKYLAEEKLDRSLFTGLREKGTAPQRLTEALLPIAGKVRRSPYGSKLPTGAGIGLNSDDPEQNLARWISALTGLRAYRTDTNHKKE